MLPVAELMIPNVLTTPIRGIHDQHVELGERA